MLFSVFQEISNNDLKYGMETSRWIFKLTHGRLSLNILTGTTYVSSEKKERSLGEKEIIDKFTSLGIYWNFRIINGMYSAEIIFPHQFQSAQSKTI